MGVSFLALIQLIFPVHKYLKFYTDELNYKYFHAAISFEKVPALRLMSPNYC